MRLPTIVAIFALLMLFSGFSFAENIIDDSKETSYLFVISGMSGSLDGDKLTLNGVPNVVYFSDRPDRVAGHISFEEFVESWNKGSDSFKADPPNATLSVLDKNGAQNVVIELLSLEQKNGALHFKVKMLEGNITGSFERVVLFIDIFVGSGPECVFIC